jgi:hypothetical protein
MVAASLTILTGRNQKKVKMLRKDTRKRKGQKHDR